MNTSNAVAPTKGVGVSLKVQSPKINALARRFKQFSRKTAEGILEMGRTVHEARQLSGSEFQRFCELIQMKTSNLKKLAVIGSKYEYLMSRADKLPTSWSTVYAVAQLANEEIERLIDNGLLSQRTAASDLDAALGKKPKPHAARLGRLSDGLGTQAVSSPQAPDPLTAWSFQVQLDPNPDPATRQVLKNLLDQMRAMKMQVHVADQLEGFLQAA
jgi:hypothetical protein